MPEPEETPPPTPPETPPAEEPPAETPPVTPPPPDPEPVPVIVEPQKERTVATIYEDEAEQIRELLKKGNKTDGENKGSEKQIKKVDDQQQPPASTPPADKRTSGKRDGKRLKLRSRKRG